MRPLFNSPPQLFCWAGLAAASPEHKAPGRKQGSIPAARHAPKALLHWDIARITEPLRLEKTSKITKSNHHLGTGCKDTEHGRSDHRITEW